VNFAISSAGSQGSTVSRRLRPDRDRVVVEMIRVKSGGQYRSIWKLTNMTEQEFMLA
jgi:hypothetical protein